ncbi:pantoate--beta-alanine ligase [uncultured Flavobacterium sp.]|uniref:pantoate--beta-alanine ligase n=1 Tax=uncultured Flavobacterium sp. TaxID=165435 RepID=UPI0025E71E34|nr:pantoate--beta-alanine ligase [uncultured Flavobacterium sp.]
MFIINNKADLSSFLSRYYSEGLSVGFVPTMGALHRGHLSLLERSVRENEVTVISIFVNPTQFNNSDDLDKYPRTLEVDVEKVGAVSEEIIVFTPSVDEMYEGDTQSVSFSFDGLEHQMEGSHRPGHFDGVGTIVKKFFEYVQPTKAYFGEKDFQQLQIVKKLVEKNNISVTVVGCPITREPNGLAMSSRNQRLNDGDREKAAFIYKTLLDARERFNDESITDVKKHVLKAFSVHSEFEVEYFEIAAEDDLVPTIVKENKKYRAFIAVMLSNVRLIDNVSLN